MPTEYLSKSAAAAAVGMINGVGSVAGFCWPLSIRISQHQVRFILLRPVGVGRQFTSRGLLVLRLPKRDLTAAG